MKEPDKISWKLKSYIWPALKEKLFVAWTIFQLVIYSLLLVTSLICLSSCSPVISEGEVYRKEFRPAETVITLRPLILSNGKTITIINMTYSYSYPDRWVIHIKDYNSKEDKFDTEDFFVTEEIFDEISVGDWFVYSDDGTLREEPYSKKTKEEGGTR